MAMHQPVTGSLGSPCHVERTAGKHLLGHHRKLLLTSKFLEMILIANSVHLKIEPVQMHSVVGIARVNPSPAYGLADSQSQPLSVGPGFAVDRRKSIEGVASDRDPCVDDKHSITFVCAGGIDDKGTG